MGYWSIVVPESTTNLILNPSVEVDTVGYAASGAGCAIARVAGGARRGLWSLGVTPTAGTSDGEYYLTSTLATATPHTFSFDFKGVLNVPYTAYFATTAPAVKGTPITWLGTGLWQRKTVTWTTDAGATFRLYVVKNNSADTGVFYLDGLQLEAKAYATTFVNPEMTPPAGFVSNGCIWNGVKHASTSTRNAESRNGGQLRNLADYYFFVEAALGIGAPDVENYAAQYANPQVAGQMNQASREIARSLQLQGTIMGTTCANLTNRTAWLAYIMRPNATTDNEPFWLQFAGGNQAVEAAFRYAGGLNGGMRSGFSERVSLRLVGDYPYWGAVERD